MAGIYRNLLDSGMLRRIAVAGSILIHVVVIGWLMFGAQVRLFEQSPPAAIAVDLVSPDEIARRKTSDEPPKPEPPGTDSAPSPDAKTSPQEATSSPQPPAAPGPTAPASQPTQKAPSETQSPRMQATFGAPVTKPDVVEQYGTFFQPFDPGGYDVIKERANLKADVIAAFRTHLKTCSVRPAELLPSDDVHIVMRIALRRDGTLAAPPALVEAKASAKGPILMQAAIKALQSCQPYSMLPVDKYDEWKVLDLDFSPADFPAG